MDASRCVRCLSTGLESRRSSFHVISSFPSDSGNGNRPCENGESRSPRLRLRTHFAHKFGIAGHLAGWNRSSLQRDRCDRRDRSLREGKRASSSPRWSIAMTNDDNCYSAGRWPFYLVFRANVASSLGHLVASRRRFGARRRRGEAWLRAILERFL